MFRTLTPALTILYAFCLCAGAENLVANPGFEAGADGDFAAWPMQDLDGAALAWDAQVAHRGARSVRVDGLAPEAQSRYVQAWRQDVPTPDAGPLWLSAWVRADGLDAGRINVLHKAADGEVLRNQHAAHFDGSFGWREIGVALDAVPDRVSVQLVLGLVKSGGRVWFDDVSLTPLADAEADVGAVRLEPSEPQSAGATVPVAFHATLGALGLARGGSLRLQLDDWRTGREFRFSAFEAEASAPGAQFEVTVPPKKQSWPPEPQPVVGVATLAEGGPLPAGAEVVVRARLRYAQHTNVACTATMLLAPEPKAAARPLAGTVPLRVTAGPPAELRCIAEARPLADTASRLTVAVLDAFGNPIRDFAGPVSFACNTDAGLPDVYGFTPADAGSHVFQVRFPADAVSVVTVRAAGLETASNPVVPRAPGEPGVYFGDIHSHCEISADAVGDPDEAYDYARDFWGLDFAALSDHSPIGDAWRRAMDVANRHNEPGRFVTFLGFEWSDPVAGHRNAYYRGATGYEQPRGLGSNMQPWWDLLEEQGLPVLTIPHHPNTQSIAKRADGRPVWGPMDWSVINHQFQRVVEVCQLRGSFEAPGPNPELGIVRDDCGASVQAALAMGHKLGFIGSTDTHSGRPGTGPARCVILSAKLERAALWDALYARRCYATNGPHILLWFRVNDAPMGSEIALPTPRKSRYVQLRAVGTAPLERVDLICAGRIVKQWRPEGVHDLDAFYTFDRPIEEPEYWRLRVLQEDGGLAWSSPVWVNPPSHDEGQE